jgi:hypothetical protein
VFTEQEVDDAFVAALGFVLTKTEFKSKTSIIFTHIQTGAVMSIAEGDRFLTSLLYVEQQIEDWMQKKIDEWEAAEKEKKDE